MTLGEICQYIINHNIVKNWEYDAGGLVLFFKHYNLYFIYENGNTGNLFMIIKKPLEKDLLMYKKELQHALSCWGTVFIYESDIYLQCPYKQFHPNMIDQHFDIMDDIAYCFKNVKNIKKNFLHYPLKNMNIN